MLKTPTFEHRKALISQQSFKVVNTLFNIFNIFGVETPIFWQYVRYAQLFHKKPKKSKKCLTKNGENKRFFSEFFPIMENAGRVNIGTVASLGTQESARSLKRHKSPQSLDQRLRFLAGPPNFEAGAPLF